MSTRISLTLIFCCAAILGAPETRAQTAPRMVADLTPGPGTLPGNPSSPRYLGTMKSNSGVTYAYFAATTAALGEELWRTDGTENGTRLVADIAPGARGSFPSQFVEAGNRGFFVADDGIHGPELWVTHVEDGTSAVLLRDIRPGPAGSSITAMTKTAAGVVYFAADDGTTGLEPWMSGGTAATTSLVLDVHAGLLGSSPEGFTRVGPSVYFSATHPSSGREVWKHDGSGSVLLLRDIVSGGGSSNPRKLFEFQNRLYFFVDAPSSSFDLWKSDGTTTGTVAVAGGAGYRAPAGSSQPGAAHLVGNRAVFLANTVLYGTELYALDAAETITPLEISPGGWGSARSVLGVVGDWLYFVGLGASVGAELYKTDGTVAGTALVKDINPGTAPSDPTLGAATQTLLYFVATSAATGTELFRTDGTAAGTVVYDHTAGPAGTSISELSAIPSGALLAIRDLQVEDEPYFAPSMGTTVRMLKDIFTGTALLGSYPSGFATLPAVAGGRPRTVFWASTPTTGEELWGTDGTAAGTHLLWDFTPGPTGTGPSPFVPYNGKLYFTQRSGSFFQLLATDGTIAGTDLVYESSAPLAYLTVFNGRLHFFTATGDLMATNGTPDSATVIAGNFRDIQPGPAVSGTLLYFAASSVENTNGVKLYRTDGTSAGTRVVEDVVAASVHTHPRWLTPWGASGLIFTASTTSEGVELFHIDASGRAALLMDIHAGAASSSPAELTVANGRVFFVATNNAQGRELWATNGTPAGTAIVADIQPGAESSDPAHLVGIGTGVVFSAFNSTSGREPWFSNGSTTSLLADIGRAGTDLRLSSNPRNFVSRGSVAYFTAQSAEQGEELWRTDGGAPPTLVRDIHAGAADSAPRALGGGIGTELFFAARDAQGNVEPWVTDGTEMGTRLLRDLAVEPTPDSTSPELLMATSDRSYFRVPGPAGRPSELWTTDGTRAGTARVMELRAEFEALGTFGRIFVFKQRDMTSSRFELWRTDGTTAGTFRVGDYDQPPVRAVSLEGAVLFVIFTDSFGSEVWKTDGTSSGTTIVRDIVPGTASSGPRQFVRLGSFALFTADVPGIGRELWRTDGTAEGTVLVSDIYPGTGNSTVAQLVAGSSVAYFVATEGVTGMELWRTDGTAAGTALVRDLNPGAASSTISQLVTVEDRAFFMFSDPALGIELWTSTGTAASTRLVREFVPGTFGARIEDRIAYGSRLFFAVHQPETGVELWSSDGTEAGTTKYAELMSGTLGSHPRFVGVHRGSLFFSAASRGEGAELWKTYGPAASLTQLPLAPGPAAGGTLSRQGARSHLVGSTVLFAGYDGAGQTELWAYDLDTTPPVLTPVYAGTPGDNGWWRSNLDVSFDIVDRESRALVISCPAQSFTQDTRGVFASCSAQSEGGIAATTVEIRIDRVPPTMTCPASRTVEATSPSGAEVTIAAGAAQDTFDPAPRVTLRPASGSTFPLGVTRVEQTATDVAGNSTRCQFDVAVVDTTPPTLVCPSDVSVKADEPSGARVNYEVVATDAATAAVALALSHPSGTEFPVGTTEVSVTATDGAGHQVSCRFKVEVAPYERRSHYGLGCAAAGADRTSLALLVLAAVALLAARKRRSRAAAVATALALATLMMPATALAQAPAREKLAFLGITGTAGIDANTARAVSEFTQSELLALGYYEVIGPTEIATLIGIERQRQLMGCSDDSEACLAEIGGAIDSSRALTGTVSVVGDSALVNLSLLDSRKGKLINRIARRMSGGGSVDRILDGVRPMLVELVSADPFVQERRAREDAARVAAAYSPFSGVVVGLRADVDALRALRGAFAPAVTVAWSNRTFGAAVAAFAQRSPGVRVEGRYYPLELGQVRPFAALGAAAFLTGVGGRVGGGAEVKLGAIHLFADVGYERFFLGDATRYLENAVVLGVGAGYQFR